jgi:hypothetical protein
LTMTIEIRDFYGSPLATDHRWNCQTLAFFLVAQVGVGTGPPGSPTSGEATTAALILS